MTSCWVVRAGKGGAFVDRFLDQKYVAIDFNAAALGALPRDVTREELVERMAALMPNAKVGTVQGHASQTFRFHAEVKVRDLVVTGDPGRRRYLLGVITSEPRFEGGEHRRSVIWTHRVSRDALQVESLNTLGAIQTLFRVVEDVVADLQRNQTPLDAPEDPSAPATLPPPPSDGQTIHQLMADYAGKADAFIEDLLNQLDAYEMQELVAGILRAMGYKTRISAKGADRGVDIFASPDGLGLEEPRIFVEVKHRSASMGSQELRAFLGARKAGDRCLYVSTGGFSKDAKYEAERSMVPLTLIDLPALRELLLEHYEKLDTETKQMVPLRRVYWPLGDG
jgi:restriction system protein